jgi:hypothetical protein
MSLTLPFWKRLDQWLHPAGAVMTAELAEDDQPVVLPPDQERRRAIRRSVHIETQCMLIALVKSDPWLVLVLDISTTGVGFEFCYPIPAGTFVMLELPRRSGRDPQLLTRAQVVSAREQDDGSYLIGCAFARRLAEEEVAEVG